MKPNKTLAKSQALSNSTIELVEHDGEFYIYLDRQPLFSTRANYPEQALAQIAFLPIARQKQPSIFVCGLGLGQTLLTLLSLCPPQASLTLLESLPELVEWHRTLLPPDYARNLLDPRLTINTGNIRQNLAGRKKRVDAVLIDADAGNELLSGNAIKTFLELLTPKGCISIKAARSHSLKPLLNRLHLHYKCFHVPARHGGKTSTHSIWVISRQRASLPAQDRPEHIMP